MQVLLELVRQAEMGLAADEVPHAVLSPRPDLVEAPVPAPRAVELRRVVLVAAVGPGGAGPGEAERARERDEGDEDADRPRPQLALQVAHNHEAHVERHDGEGDPARTEDELVGLSYPQGDDVGEEERGERDAHDDGVDRRPAGLGPVDVVEVQDQGELVERQGRAGAEDAGEDLERGAAGREGELQDAGHDHGDDPEHRVMDVEAGGTDVGPEPPALLGADHARVEADEGERGDETEQKTDERPPAVREDGGRERGGDGGEGVHCISIMRPAAAAASVRCSDARQVDRPYRRRDAIRLRQFGAFRRVEHEHFDRRRKPSGVALEGARRAGVHGRAGARPCRERSRFPSGWGRRHAGAAGRAPAPP